MRVPIILITMINKYFYEVFENIPRQGPGSNAETKYAFTSLSDLPANPAIVDVGCGKGVQTLELATISKGHVIALDRHGAFLQELQNTVSQLKLQNKISCLKADMAEMPFMRHQFDLIWAEGSVFIVGYKFALENWRELLKEGGYFVFSDCVWLKDNPPSELLDFWKNEGIDIPSKEEILEKAKEESFKIVNHFTLAKSSWKKEFYDHIELAVKSARMKYKGNEIALKTLDFIIKEVEMYDKYNDYFGYEFFILQRR